MLLRTGADTWEHGAEFLNVPLATINTMVLIFSSVTMVMSWASLKMKNFGRFKLYLGLTILCGLGFLVIKGFEYAAKFEHHLLPSTSTFMALMICGLNPFPDWESSKVYVFIIANSSSPPM